MHSGFPSEPCSSSFAEISVLPMPGPMGSSLIQIKWFLVLLTVGLKSSPLGFVCWLPTSCLLSGFQKFIAIDSLSILFTFGVYTLKKIIYWCFSGISGRNRDKDVCIQSTILNWKSQNLLIPSLDPSYRSLCHPFLGGRSHQISLSWSYFQPFPIQSSILGYKSDYVVLLFITLPQLSIHKHNHSSSM